MRRLWIFFLSLLGLFEAVYLLWAYTSASRPLVCLGTECDVVRASRYAHLWGLPLPFYGAGMYAALAALVFIQVLAPSEWGRKGARFLLVVISGLGFAYSIYLTYLEAFVIHALCEWCAASAVTVTLILLLAILDVVKRQTQEPAPFFSRLKPYLAVLGIALALGIPTFIYLQHSGEIPATRPATAQALAERLVRPDSHTSGDFTGVSHTRGIRRFSMRNSVGVEEERQSKKVEHQYGSRIRFVFRQFPVTELHQYAEKAAEASECAAEQGKFWEAERKFYENQSGLSISSLERYAAELGLDVNRFHECLSTGEMSDRVKRDMEDGRALGVRRTPTLFLGHEQIVGGVDYDKLAELIDQQLTHHMTILVQGEKAQMPNAADAQQSSGDAAQAGPPLSSLSSVGAGIGDSGNVFTQYAGAGLGCSRGRGKAASA